MPFPAFQYLLVIHEDELNRKQNPTPSETDHSVMTSAVTASDGC